MTPIAPVNVVSREFKANPFPFYAQLRREAPVYPVTLPGRKKAWLVTRYDDVSALLKDERFAKNPANAKTEEQQRKEPWMPGVFKAIARNMLDLDAPDHTRLKALVHKAFTPKLVEQMRGRVQTLADELLDAIEKRGKMDAMRDYAVLIPTTIIAEVLGIPVEDRLKFYHWSTIAVSMQSRKNLPRIIWTVVLFTRYLRRLIEDRRRNPKDDLMTALVQAEEAGDKLSEDELLAMVVILLIAGHETTVNLIGNGILALLEHPEQMAKLRENPELIKPAIEELMRFTCPVEWATERYARQDIELHGVTIPRGELVLGVLGSANRDESQFEKPDCLEISREINRHVGFGQGMHYCVGAPLARLEAQIAILTLLCRMPDLRLSPSEKPKWRKTIFLRGLESLPVEF